MSLCVMPSERYLSTCIKWKWKSKRPNYCQTIADISRPYDTNDSLCKFLFHSPYMEQKKTRGYNLGVKSFQAMKTLATLFHVVVSTNNTFCFDGLSCRANDYDLYPAHHKFAPVYSLSENKRDCSGQSK